MKKRDDINKILIIGSGPIIIGQACEFDYSGTQACKALKKLGYEIVLVNSNPATIMTDPATADVTYIEPLNVERLTQIIEKERPDGLLPNLGGQTGLNLCSELYKTGVLDKYGVKVIGVKPDAIERGEDRIEFKELMNSLGIEMARSEVAYSVDEALAIADKLGYPVVLRPAYTMGGAGGGLVYNVDELCRLIIDTPVNMESWYEQKAIQKGKQEANLLELGFSTFFLNRTNRSGIIKAGVIGGKNQTGNFKMDARYKKEELIQRIRRINAYADRIELHNEDAIGLIKGISPQLPENSLIYFDPPYYKGV